MHEAAIANSILDIADNRAASMAESVVEEIRVRIGTFRNVDPETLVFAFEALKQHHDRCHQARLEMEIVDAVALCTHDHQYKPSIGNAFCCSQCQSGISKLLSGYELDVINCRLSVPEEANQLQGETYARIDR